MPSMGVCSTPLIAAGGLDADELEQRRQQVDGVHVLVAGLAGRAERAAGQRTISGSVTPPSWVSRFHRLSGVLPAHAQPHG